MTKVKHKERALSSFKIEDQKDILAVQAVEAGRDAEFVRVMERYRPHLEQRFFLKVKNKEVARDLTSEVMAKVYQKVKLGKYRPTHTFNAWFYMLSDRFLIDWSRKSEWKFQTATSSIDNTRSDSEGNESNFSDILRDEDAATDTTVLQEERAKAIREGLGTLDDIGRRLVDMFYGKEMSYEEMAAAMDMNTNTMKVQLMRAKRKLAEYIARAYPEFAMRPMDGITLGTVRSEKKVIEGEEHTFYYAQ